MSARQTGHYKGQIYKSLILCPVCLVCKSQFRVIQIHTKNSNSNSIQIKKLYLTMVTQ